MNKLHKLSAHSKNVVLSIIAKGQSKSDACSLAVGRCIALRIATTTDAKNVMETHAFAKDTMANNSEIGELYSALTSVMPLEYNKVYKYTKHFVTYRAIVASGVHRYNFTAGKSTLSSVLGLNSVTSKKEIKLLTSKEGINFFNIVNKLFDEVIEEEGSL